jgi:hypothetical protein
VRARLVLVVLGATILQALVARPLQQLMVAPAQAKHAHQVAHVCPDRLSESAVNINRSRDHFIRVSMRMNYQKLCVVTYAHRNDMLGRGRVCTVLGCSSRRCCVALNVLATSKPSLPEQFLWKSHRLFRTVYFRRFLFQNRTEHSISQ